MWLRIASRLLGAALSTLAGVVLIYFALWLTWNEIVPQVRVSGLSLSGSHLILNRDWRDNQLYLLVALYGVVGCALLTGGFILWRGRRRDPAPPPA